VADNNVEITALIAPSGAAGFGSADGSDRWTLGVPIEAWRMSNGPIRRDALYLKRYPLSRGALHDMQAALGGVQLVRLRLAADPEPKTYESGYSRLEAELIEVVGKASDSQLQTLADELSQPVTIADEFFGELRLDRRLKAYEARRGSGRMQYDVLLTLRNAADPVQDRAMIQTARATLCRLEELITHYRNRAADELLSLYNDDWRQDEDPALTREQFIERLTLTSVTLESDGEIFVYLQPGDLFGGHVIEIRAKTPDQITELGLAG
jgi:hypothetical protein